MPHPDGSRIMRWLPVISFQGLVKSGAAPSGDEVIIVLDGVVTFLRRQRGEEDPANLSKQGICVAVPRGVWHRARVSKQSKVLFIRPGEGAQHTDTTVEQAGPVGIVYRYG